MRRVLIVVSKNIEAGGVEFYLCKVLERIDKSQLEIDVLVPGRIVSTKHAEQLKQMGCQIIELLIENEGVCKYWRLFRKLKKILKEKKYDVIHVNTGALAIEAISLVLAKKNEVDIKIAHSHGTIMKGIAIKEFCRNILREIVVKNADYCLACSTSAAISLFGEKNANKAIIANNGIETDKYIFDSETRNRIRKEFNWDGKYVIGCVGRIAAEKNHKYLIEIFKEIVSMNSNSVLVLIGSGELENDIRKQVEMLGLTEAVQFLGVRDDVNELLQGIDVFVLTSIREALGIVNIEAQASGMHCVVSDVIPTEVNVTDLVDFMNIDDEPINWAKQILKYNDGYKRKNNTEEIKKRGYELSCSAKIIEEVYMGVMYNNRKED